MKVLFVTDHSDRPEAETLIALNQAGIDTTVICPKTAPHFSRLQAAGIDTIDFRLKRRIDLKGIRLIRNTLKHKNIQIMQMFNNKAVSNGVLASIGLNVRLVAYRGIVGNVSYFDPASWMTYLNPKIDVITCVADAITQYFHNMKILGIPFPINKAITLYKGHDLSWYQSPAVPLNEFEIPENSFVIGCIANNRPRKGLSYLIDAMTCLKEQQHIHLLLIGQMDNQQVMDKICDESLRNRIHFTGFRTDAPQIVASCDTAVLPAIKREGLPKAIIEAMVYNVPPIVTNSGGSPELIVDNESGYIVPVKDSAAIADAILKLYRDKDLKHEMGIAAQQRISNQFNHRDTVKNTINLFRKLTP